MKLLAPIAEIKLESNLITLLEVFIYILTEIVCLMEMTYGDKLSPSLPEGKWTSVHLLNCRPDLCLQNPSPHYTPGV